MSTTTYNYTNEKGTAYRVQRWKAKQAKPIDYSQINDYGVFRRKVLVGEGLGYWSRVTDFEGTNFWNEADTNYGWSFSSAGISSSVPNHEAYNRAYAKAYGKFVEACMEGGERSQMLTNLAERHETFEMVLSRMKQIYKGAKALRQGNFRGFCNTFGIKPKKKHAGTKWTRPRDFSALWLEYWFGWSPTVADLNNALEVYGHQLSDPWIIVKGSSAARIGNSEAGIVATYSSGDRWMTQTNAGVVRVRLTGKVACENSTLFNLNNLGLINIPLTAYELIPFSWFAGWSGNIAQVLGQSTDFVGLKLSELSLSVKAEWTHAYQYTQGTPSGSVIKVIRQKAYTRKKMTRLPRVKLVWRIPPELSPTRGATLASLIVQIFSPPGKRS